MKFSVDHRALPPVVHFVGEHSVLRRYVDGAVGTDCYAFHSVVRPILVGILEFSIVDAAPGSAAVITTVELTTMDRCEADENGGASGIDGS